MAPSPALPTGPRRVLLALLLFAAAGCARSVEEWRARLAHPDPFERALAALALCHQAPQRAGPAVPVLLETLDRVDLGLGDEAAAALARVGPAVAAELVTELGRERFPSLERQRALKAALISAGPAAVAPLVAALAGPGRERAGELGAALTALGAPAAPALAELLVRTTDAELAAYAAWLLGRLGPRAEAARSTLEVAAEGHPVPGVRAAAREALAELGPAPPARSGPPPVRPAPGGTR